MSPPDDSAPSAPLAARLFRVASVAFPLILVVAVVACNVVRMQHQGLRRDFARAGMQEHTATLGPDTLHYWRSAEDGPRPPVLLLHGFGGAAVWQWAEQLPALAPDRTVLVPDLLWFGGSSSTDDDPTLEHQVAAIVALLDRERLPRVDVVGISYGGLVAWLLTREHGDRVRRLVLVDSPGPAYTEQDQRALLERFEIQRIPELIIPGDEAAVERLLGIAYHDPPRTPAFALRQVKREMYDPYREAQTALLHALEEGWERYASEGPLGAEVGLIWGDEDPVFPLAIAERLAAALSAPLHVIPQARHAPNLEHPQRFNEALRQLLDGAG